jgi:hypothetical protein
MATKIRYGNSFADEQFAPQDSRNGFPEVTIAVVGEENAGKTSFVKCALDMKNPPHSTCSRKKMSLDGSVYIVHLLEVDLAQVQFDQRKIIWPRTGSASSAPAIDGVLVLHDATKPDRLSLTTNLICMFTPDADGAITSAMQVIILTYFDRLLGCLEFAFLTGGMQM